MKVAAIILAAGGSSRFGQPKQLVRLAGQPLVRRIGDVALQADCSPVLAVVGASVNQVCAALDELDVEIVQNENWSEGIASSIRAGVQQLGDADAIVLLSCDQPLVRPETLRALIELYQTSGKAIAAAQYENTLGIPALFDRSLFPDLLALTGDRGAKAIILARRNEVVTLDFPDGAIDIDTVADYERFSSNA